MKELRELLKLDASQLEELRQYFSQSLPPQQMISPNRPLSIMVTLAGITMLVLSGFNPFGFRADVQFLCGFFGCTVLAGGVALLLFEVGYSTAPEVEVDELLAQTEYEQAFRVVVADQSVRGHIDEDSIQKGVDLLVAHGVSPDDALKNLCRVLCSFVEED